MTTKKKRVKPLRMFLFAYETKQGHWNTSKSFYESEEKFREAHGMSKYIRVVQTTISIIVPEKTPEQIAYEEGLNTIPPQTVPCAPSFENSFMSVRPKKWDNGNW